MEDITVLILAAGKGTRMKTNVPKCLTLFHYKPMLSYILNTLNKMKLTDIGLIVGYKKEEIKKHIKKKVTYIYQKEQLGTGNAVESAEKFYKGKNNNIIIIPSDIPLINDDILNKLIKYHIDSSNDLTIVSNIIDNPFGYGRILRNKENKIIRIIEEKDANFEEKKIKEINTGIYIIKESVLTKNIKLIKNNNSKKEFYLTDIIEILFNNNYKIDSLSFYNNFHLTGVNDLESLINLELKYQMFLNKEFINKGIHLINPDTIIIEDTVEIEDFVTIDAFCVIKGKTKIKKGSYIKPYTYIINNKIID